MARKLLVSRIIVELYTILVGGEVSGKFKINWSDVGIVADEKRRKTPLGSRSLREHSAVQN